MDSLPHLVALIIHIEELFNLNVANEHAFEGDHAAGSSQVSDGSHFAEVLFFVAADLIDLNEIQLLLIPENLLHVILQFNLAHFLYLRLFVGLL